MPDERYRLFGKFVSRETAEEAGWVGVFRELYERGKRVSRESGAPEEPTPQPTYEPEPASGGWDDRISEHNRATIREEFNQKGDYIDLSDDAYDDPPNDAQMFQVRFKLKDNPDYPRGWGSWAAQYMKEWGRVREMVEDGKGYFGEDAVPVIVFYRAPS